MNNGIIIILSGAGFQPSTVGKHMFTFSCLFSVIRRHPLTQTGMLGQTVVIFEGSKGNSPNFGFVITQFHGRIDVPCRVGSGTIFFTENPIQKAMAAPTSRHRLTNTSNEDDAIFAKHCVEHSSCFFLRKISLAPTWSIFAVAGCMNGRGP